MTHHARNPAQPSSSALLPQDDQRESTAQRERAVAPDGAAAEPEDEYIGQLIDHRYLVEAVIGQGGMGVVYRCRHHLIGKKLALKIIRAAVAGSEATQRFLIEAKAASAIGNEHIIHVSDFGELPDGASYLVMELLEGASLAEEFLAHWPFPVPRIVSIATQLADALSAAHQAGIVHRDLKPENIFLVPHGRQRDFVKILDFGIAKMSLGGANVTRAGSVIGTPRYMSPEQAAGTAVDQRGDIYSLGVLLYELLAGRPPFDGEHPMSILAQHIYEAPPAFAVLAPKVEVPVELERIVWKCLAKRPENRYASMEDLAIELLKFGAGGVANPPRAREWDPAGERRSAPTQVTSAPASRSAGRSRVAPRVWAVGGALLLAALGALWLLLGERRAPALAPAAAPPSPPAALVPAAAAPASAPRVRPIEAAPEPVPVEAAPPAAGSNPPPSASAREPRQSAAKPRPRRKSETEFVNPWPAPR